LYYPYTLDSFKTEFHMKIAAVAILAVSLVPLTCYAESMTDSISSEAAHGMSVVTTEVSDTAITTQVKAALAAKPGMSSMAIGVTTENGIVHLDGKVKTTNQIKDAVEITKKVNGVKGVDATKLIVGN
jgi:osmotically-inducible protein OsmY